MKKNIVYSLFFFLVTLHSFSQKNVAFPKTYSFEEVAILQKTTPKPMVVFLHTNWCKFCFAMKKNAFTNKKVIELLNNKYYFIMLNGEHKSDIKFYDKTYKYKPTGSTTGVHELAEILGTKNGKINYPTTVIVSSNFTIDSQLDTFLSNTELQKILTEYQK